MEHPPSRQCQPPVANVNNSFRSNKKTFAIERYTFIIFLRLTSRFFFDPADNRTYTVQESILGKPLFSMKCQHLIGPTFIDISRKEHG